MRFPVISNAQSLHDTICRYARRFVFSTVERHILESFFVDPDRFAKERVIAKT